MIMKVQYMPVEDTLNYHWTSEFISDFAIDTFSCQSFSLESVMSHLSLADTDLLEFDHSRFGQHYHWWW